MTRLLVILCLVIGGGHIVFAQGLDKAFVYSTSGLLVQKVRLSIIAENVANVSTFMVEETGLPYQKQYAVVVNSPFGARIKQVAKSLEPFQRYYDPAAPQVDKNGFYYFPNINLPDEMVNLAFTEAMYKTNLNAIKTHKAVYQATIDALK